jgi:hypothetical protein
MLDEVALVVGQLEQNANATRIKKLLLYTCKNWWENDSPRLDAISLRALVEELRQTHTTLDHLRSRLNHFVGTLNKSTEYVPIAQSIVSALEPLYQLDPTGIILPPEIPTPNPTLQNLEQDINLSRIKKLLICVCRKYWEANPQVIEQIQLRELIDELRHLHPTLTSAKAGLAAIVKTLNKPVEYALITETILREVEPLYGNGKEETSSDPTIETQVSDAVNLFDVRLEILKYANPLRAKILLFSSAYYLFQFRQEDWSNLKLYSLDGLLRTVLSQNPSLDQLQHSLQAQAEQLPDTDLYVEVVSVITRALRTNFSLLQRQIQHLMQMSSIADVTCASSTQFVLPQVSEFKESH